MSKGNWLLKAFKIIGLVLAMGVSMSGCADTLSWQEEVKLLDGRIIVVAQKRQYERAYNGSNFGGVPRESWLTLKLPETGNQEITWHEKLKPSNLNIANGKLYIVGIPPTSREFYLYNKPRPPYIGYVFENKAWQPIPFNEIPVDIYDMNLSIDSENYIQAGHITLADKTKELRDPTLPKVFKRIDSSYKDPDDHK
jgi:hypothetical protein